MDSQGELQWDVLCVDDRGRVGRGWCGDGSDDGNDDDDNSDG